MSVASVLLNRNFAALIVANTILGCAFPIQLILGGLAGVLLAPEAALATLPASVQTLAALVVAAPVSLLMGRLGRRAGFSLGALVAALGAALAVAAVYTQNFALLCVAHFLMGAGWTTFQFFRFAAAEAVAPDWRPVAISLMLSALLIAALAGPQIFIVTQDALAPIPFAGAYAAVGTIALLGLLPLAALRMPVPQGAPQADAPARFAALGALRRPAIRRAVGIAAASQGVMVFVMIPTPIAMIDCGFDAATTGDVIRWHIVAMFAPSFFTGFLIRRFGAERVAATGLVIIIAAAVGAATGISALHFYGALIVLGVGWNFGFVGATAMLDAAVSEAEKPALQGLNDTAIALVSTLCAFGGGLVVATQGWAVLAGLSAGIAGLALMALSVRRRGVPADGL